MQSSIRKIIELSGQRISLDLTVLGIRVELAEGGEFLHGEGANLVFEPFDFAPSGLRKTATQIMVAGTPLQ